MLASFSPGDEQSHLQGVIIAYLRHSFAMFPTKAIAGIIASFPSKLIDCSGNMCVVHNQQTSITHCLCIGFLRTRQRRFQECIFDNLNELRDPQSLLLLRFDVIINAIREQCDFQRQEIGRFAGLLSTGSYSGPKSDPKASFQLDLNEISRKLTATADFCAALKFNTIRLLRILEDFREITTADKDAPDPTGGIDLRAAKWYRGEDMLGYSILVLRGLAEISKEDLQGVIRS